MNKISYIFFGIILLLIIAISVTTFLQRGNDNVTTADIVYSDLNIIFPNPTGVNVVVDNFLSNSSVQLDGQNPGMYTLGNSIAIDPITKKLPDYSITYDKVSGSFSVTLLQKPFTKSRESAQQYLKQLLKIEDSNMCGLKYMVTIPGYVDTTASGLDYRFSFCPGAVQL